MQQILDTIPSRHSDDATFYAAFCVDVEVRPSAVHGEGVHLLRPVRKGAILCNVFRSPDITFATESEILRLWEHNPRAAVLVTGRIYGDYFAYGTHMDAECYLNHSDDANAINYLGQTIALRDIDAGEEVTIDYRFIFAPQMYITTGNGRVHGYTSAEARERGDRILAGLLGSG